MRAGRRALSARSGYTHWLGTDAQGRDLLSAILYGLRISLQMGLAGRARRARRRRDARHRSPPIVGGRIETLIMRIVDLQLSFPAILLALVLVGAARPGQDAADHRARRRAIRLFRPHRLRRRLGRAAQGLCRGGAATPLSGAPHRLPPHPAELPAAADRGRDGADRERDLARGDAVVPRPRPAADRAVARHADRQRLPVHDVRPLLDLGLSRHRADHPDRRHQPRRRPDPRPAQSEAASDERASCSRSAGAISRRISSPAPAW